QPGTDSAQPDRSNQGTGFDAGAFAAGEQRGGGGDSSRARLCLLPRGRKTRPHAGLFLRRAVAGLADRRRVRTASLDAAPARRAGFSAAASQQLARACKRLARSTRCESDCSDERRRRPAEWIAPARREEVRRAVYT